jgi:hypothetical protein
LNHSTSLLYTHVCSFTFTISVILPLNFGKMRERERERAVQAHSRKETANYKGKEESFQAEAFPQLHEVTDDSRTVEREPVTSRTRLSRNSRSFANPQAFLDVMRVYRHSL